MALTFSGTSQFRLDATYKSTGDLSDASAALAIAKAIAWTSGTGNNQANRYYEDTVTLASSATQNYDLTGSLTDKYGNTLTLVSLRGLIVHNKSSTDGDTLNVYGNFFTKSILTGWVDDPVKLKLTPGGMLIVQGPQAADHYATAVSDDTLTLENAGSNSLDADIVIWGTQ